MQVNGAGGARVWILGFAGATIILVCCSLPKIVRTSIREERTESSVYLYPIYPHDVSNVISCRYPVVYWGAWHEACHHVPVTDSVCQTSAGSFRLGTCLSIGVEGASMMISSVLPPRGLSCTCRKEGGDAVALASTKQALDAFFEGDAPRKIKFARGLAIAGMALASLCSLIQVCGILSWIRAKAASGSISPWRWEVSRLRTRLKAAFAQNEDLRSRRIHELATMKRLNRSRALLKCCCFWACIYLFVETAQFWRYNQGADLFLFDGLVAPCLFLLIFSLLHQLKIQEVSPLYLDIMNVSLSAIWAWKYLVHGYLRGSRVYLQSAGWLLFGRLIHGLLCGNAKLSIVLNIILAAVDIHAHGVAQDLRTTPNHMLQQQMGICIIMSLVFWWDDQQLLAEATALMDAETSNSKYSLAHRVLKATCDAVAFLDADLSLLESCPKLAQMLLRHPKAAHEGCSFVDFVSQDHDDDEDDDDDAVDRVRRLMQEEVEAASRDPTKLDPAGTVHVDMIDAYQNKVPVQLYWCCAAQRDGRVQHLVGISQRGEHVEKDAETSNGQSLSPVKEGMTMSFVRPTSVTSSQRSASAAESADEEVQITEEEIRVCIDAASRTLTLLWCSNAFLLLCGSYGPGSGLSEWLKDETDAFASFLSSSRSGAGFHKVVLHPPGIQGWWYSARCCRCAVQPERHIAAAEDASIDAVELIFDHLKFRTPDAKSHHRRVPRAPCATMTSPLRGHSASVDVGLPSCNILGVDFVFGDFSDELLSTLKVGRSMQACLVNHSLLFTVLPALVEVMQHGTQLDDAAGKDLGSWDVFTEDSGTRLVQFTLAGFQAPSKEAEPDSVVCRLKMHIIGQLAAAPARAVPRLSRESKAGPWITLGVDETAGASDNVLVTARSAEVVALLGFDPLGQSFLTWLSCPREFLEWGEALHDIEPGRTAEEVALEFGEITLRPGRLVEQGLAVKASCRCVTLPNDSKKEDLFTVQLRAARRVRLCQSL